MIDGRLNHGLNGTIICVENLFYNVPSRRLAIKYPHEEANRIIDVLGKYAIHYPYVSFAFRRMDGNSASDFRTKGDNDKHATIKSLISPKIVKELFDLEFFDDSLSFNAKICISVPYATFSSVAIQSKQDHKKVFQLFVNGRSVENHRMKQSVETVFSSKDLSCSFVNISLEIIPTNVDVNVHPTKAIVNFLFEDKIIEKIEKEFYDVMCQFRKKGVVEVNNLPNSSQTSVDVFIYFFSHSDENELMLHYALTAFHDALVELLKRQVEKRVLLETFDVVLLTLDETIDGGIILETDPRAIASRVTKSGHDGDLSLGDQTVTQVFQRAQEQLARSLLR